MIATIIRKELMMLFISPLAWVLLAAIQLILTWFFLIRLDAFLEIQPQMLQIANPPGVTEMIVSPVFALAAIVLMMIAPILSMRLFAEERRNHTLGFLLAAPVSITAIVLGKFFALMIFFTIIAILIALLSLSLLLGGVLDMGLIASNLLGLLFLTACFSALGLYFSSLTAQPAIAAVASLAALLGLWMIDLAASETGGWLHYFSLLKYFRYFNQGLIDTLAISYFLLFMVAFLVLTIRRLEEERLHD